MQKNCTSLNINPQVGINLAIDSFYHNTNLNIKQEGCSFTVNSQNLWQVKEESISLLSQKIYINSNNLIIEAKEQLEISSEHTKLKLTSTNLQLTGEAVAMQAHNISFKAAVINIIDMSQK